jgi:hypothetical protein
MALKVMKKYFMIITLTTVCGCIFAQSSVPLGIHYQAVARNNSGTELANTRISVKFSIISGNPLGTVVYQELHQDIITSKFGVFSLIIGHGIPTSVSPLSSLADISWKDANHYLKVEVKFENDFMDMGTMQFLAVPYALYAQKSLEPGPIGPTGPKGDKGEQGDPASDKQTLSFDGNNLSISGSNSTVPLTGLLQDLSASSDGTGGYNLSISRGSTINLATVEKDGDPTNEIQDLQLDINNKLKITKNPAATEIDLSYYKQNLTYTPASGLLNISNGTGADLSSLKTDAIQDIKLTGNLLTIDKNSSSVGVDLKPYKQDLSYTPASGILSISGGTGADLSSLKTDAIQDIHLTGNLLTIDKNSSSVGVDLKPYKQDLTYTPASGILSISGGTAADLTSLKTDAIQDIKLTGDLLTIDKNSSSSGVDLSKYKADNQQLQYVDSTRLLSIDNGNSVTLGTMVAFRAKKQIAETGLPAVDYGFITPIIDYNDGSGFEGSTGVFTAPLPGIYTFVVGFTASSVDDMKSLKIFLNGVIFETLNTGISRGSSLTRTVTMKLITGDKVKVMINPGLSAETGTGTFSGFKVF